MMTTEASLPADDETESFETPIERVLREAEAAEALRKPETSVDEAPENEPVAGSEAQQDATAADEAPENAPAAESEEQQEPPEAGETMETSVDEAPEDEPAAESEGQQEAPEPAAEPQEEQPQPPAREAVAEPPPAAADEELTEAMAGWTEALRSVERSINDATEAIRFLRATIQQMAPLMRSLGGLEDALSSFEEQPRRRSEPQPLRVEQTGAPLRYEDSEEEAEAGPPRPLPSDNVGRAEREWRPQQPKSIAKDKGPQWEEADSGWVPPAGARPAPKPVTLVPDETPAPFAYKVTIEDRKNPVELLEVHRALTSIPSVRNLSLLNYVSGVASISLETTDEIQPPELENAIKKVMKRSCSVVPHESNVILIQVGD
jgi:hypothetical protein